MLNARLDVLKTLPVDVGLWINNLTNKSYSLWKQDLRGSLGYTTTFQAAPRTYGIEVSARF